MPNWGYRKLLSLLEIMRRYRLGDLIQMLIGLTRASRDLGTADTLSQNICDKEFLKTLATVVDGVEIMCESIELDSSLMDQIKELHKDLADGREANDKGQVVTDRIEIDYRPSVLNTRIKTIIDGLQNNLDSKLFMFIPKDRAKYYNNREAWCHPELFSKECQFEMREAGNCYAAAVDTAAVFHLMRVAEHGLRLLARKLHIQGVSHSRKHCPIEFAEWQKLIEAIDGKIKAARQKPAGPRKQATLELYSEASQHCAFMKDIFRNNVSHSRSPYSQPETLAAFGRVVDFMGFLGKIK